MSEYSLGTGTVLAGKYRILRVLGAGGMGAVYLAENIDIGRQVAIKVLHANIGADPATRQRFRMEARTSAVIAHPGIVDVLDMGETATGEAFIVMERLDGQTLGARLKQRGRLSVEESVAVLVDVLAAIDAAHAKGVIHRDLKPDNLFLVWHPRWCVKILDFGISRFLSADDVRLTASNTLMGSVLYMPPEQARDARFAGPPADLYALGATLYHMLAGTPPFVGDSYTEVLSRVLSDAPVPLRQHRADIPEPLAALVAQLLAKDPAARPQSAAAVRSELLALVPAPTPPVEPVSAPATAGPKGLSDTALPLAQLIAETADVSTPPVAGTVAAPAIEIKIPRAAQTGSLVGEVQRVEATPPRGRRTGVWILAGAVIVAGAAGINFAMKSGPARAVSRLDAAVTAVPDAAAPQPDAAVDAVGAVRQVTDATTAVTPPTPGRRDGGAGMARPDVMTTPRTSDAASNPRDGGLMELQPLPPN